mmetsp:Transcript_62972/g.150016  ORF Transcript_62972/g.150016 Transcript_62972/m.150016 type:complete len:154 (-) Transcript_62972:159-620(-)
MESVRRVSGTSKGDQRTPLASADSLPAVAEPRGGPAQTQAQANETAFDLEVAAHEDDVRMTAEQWERISSETSKIQHVVQQLQHHTRQQGEELESIQSFVEQAEDATRQAQEQVDITERGTRRQMRRACWAFSAAMIMACIIIFVVLLRSKVI